MWSCLLALWVVVFVVVKQRRKHIIVSSLSGDTIYDPTCLVFVVLVEQRRKRIIISSLSGDTFVVLIALWFFVLVEQRRKRIMISSMSSDAIFGPACLVVVLFTIYIFLPVSRERYLPLVKFHASESKPQEQL